MKETISTKVLFCKSHCPFMCFCKPSAARLYTSKALKLEDGRLCVTSTAIAVSSYKSGDRGKEDGVNGKQESTLVGKSCIKAPPPPVPESSNDAVKKKVQWLDNLGKELAQVKEFESSEIGDIYDKDESRRCLCVIL